MAIRWMSPGNFRACSRRYIFSVSLQANDLIIGKQQRDALITSSVNGYFYGEWDALGARRGRGRNAEQGVDLGLDFANLVES